MKKVSIFCAPGFHKKTGYYFRCLRDAKNFEQCGYEVELFTFSLFRRQDDSEVNAKGVNLFDTLLSNKVKRDGLFIGENISMVLPLLLLQFFSFTKKQKLGFVYHGSLDELRYDSNGLIKYYLYRLFENLADRKFDFVFLVSKAFSNLLVKQKRLQKIRHVITPNLPDESFIKGLNTYKNKLDSEDENDKSSSRITLTYLGNAQKWQNIDYVVELCKQLYAIDQKVLVQFITNEVAQISTKLLSAEAPPDSYSVFQVPNCDVPKYLVSSDCLIVIRDVNETNIVSCPTKAIEYIYSGSKLIVSETLGDISDLVLKYNLGIVLEKSKSNDFKSLYSSILNMKLQPKNTNVDRIIELDRKKLIKVYQEL